MRDVTYTAASRFTPAPIRALRSLTEQQAATIEAGLARLPGRWMVDRHESYDGQLSLLIAPWSEELPSFTVDRDGQGLHLGRMCGDVHERLGSFADAREVLMVLGRALTTGLDGQAAPHAA